jgi:hypothetical protein
LRLARKERRELLGWLEPVETLARSCLIVRAFAFLLMTPQGRKLLQDAPRIEMPTPPHQLAAQNARRGLKIPMPGWHTIASNWRALVEQRKLEEQREAERAARDKHDPETWGGAFRIVGWSFPEPEQTRPVPAQFQKLRRVGIDVFEPDPRPVAASPLTRPRPEPEPERPAFRLARRIAQLGRVIDNPEPAIRRLARFLASLPLEALEPLKEQTASAGAHWRQGCGLDVRHAAAHVRRAAAVFGRKPEPG